MFLGIDIGTSAVKAVLAPSPGQILAATDVPLTVDHPRPGWSEQRAEDWWQAVQSAAQQLRAGHAGAWSSVTAIGLSGQMHGAVLLDRNRMPIRPVILWNDGRSVAECTALTIAVPDIGRIAGVSPMPGFTAPKLMWVAQHEPDCFAKIASVLLPKDYVRLQMTGDLVTDLADAAGTMWLDQRERSWSSRICAASGVDPSWLPLLREGPEVSGMLTPEAATKLALPQGLPVAAGGGDAAAGAMGIGAVNEGDAFISLGTSGQLFVAAEQYRPAPDGAVHAFAHCLPERWFHMAAMLNGARPLAWFAGVADANITDLLNCAARTSDVAMPYFLPYLSGERTPHNDANIRGAFYGLENGTDCGAMMRAIVDAIAYSFCDARDSLVHAGSRIEQPAAIGGGTRSNFVMQTLADALSLPILRYQKSETGPALGAARLAMVAAGAYTLADVAVTSEIDRVFEPDPRAQTYHSVRLDAYRALYAALQPFAAETAV